MPIKDQLLKSSNSFFQTLFADPILCAGNARHSDKPFGRVHIGAQLDHHTIKTIPQQGHQLCPPFHRPLPDPPRWTDMNSEDVLCPFREGHDSFLQRLGRERRHVEPGLPRTELNVRTSEQNHPLDEQIAAPAAVRPQAVDNNICPRAWASTTVPISRPGLPRVPSRQRS